jgi:TP901 family phage tail tape measure protein
MAVNLGEARGQIILDAGPAVEGTERAGKATKAMEGIVVGVSASITHAMLNMGASIARGLGDVVASGVSMAANLELQMDGVQAVMGATVDEVGLLKDEILDLGVDPNLKVSTIEAAEAIEMLGRNGLTTQEILDGAARSTVLLANATDAQFNTAADLATDTMAIFNIEAAEMESAVDGITSVVNNSKFSIEDYALALAQGGGVASDVGVEFEDFNTAIAAISPSFASGADAGTAFKVMLQRMAAPTDVAMDKMVELGLATEDGANAFFDANGNLKDMNEIAGLLEDSLADLSEQQRTQALTTLFGARAVRAASALANVGAEEFARLQEVMGDTSAAEAAATRMDNLRGAMEILDGVVENIKIQIATAFLPVLTDMARKVAAFLEQNADPFVDFFERAADRIQTFIDNLSSGTVASSISEFVEMLGNIARFFRIVAEDGDTLNDFLARLPESIQPVVKAIGDFFVLLDENRDIIAGAAQGIGALAAVFVGSKVVGAIASIVGALGSLLNPVTALIAGAAIFGVAWRKNWVGVGDLVSEVGDSLQQVFDGIKLALQGDLPGALEIFRGAWENAWGAVTEFLTNLWGMVEPKLSGLWESITTWFDEEDWQAHGRTIVTGIANALGNLWAEIEPKLIQTGEDVKGWFNEQDWAAHGQAIVDGIGNGLSTMGQTVTTAVMKTDWAVVGQNVVEEISAGLSSVGLGGAGDALGGLFEQIMPDIANIQARVQAAFRPISAVVRTAMAELAPVVSTAMEGISDAMEDLEPTIERFKVLWETLGPPVRQILQILGFGFVGAIGLAVGAINGFAQAVGPALETGMAAFRLLADVVTLVVGSVSKGVDLLVALISGNSEEVERIWKEHKAFTAELWGNIVDDIIDLVSGLVDTVVGFASGLYEGVVGFFTDLYNDLVGGSIVPDMVNDILDWVGTLRDDAIAFVEELWESVKEAFETAKADLTEKAEELAGNVTGAFEDIIDDMLTIGGDIIGGVIDGIEGAKTTLRRILSGVADIIPAWLRAFLGIDSPARETRPIGEGIVMGIIAGIQDLMPDLRSVIETLVDFAGVFSSLGSTAAQRFRAQVLDPLQAEIEGFNDDISGEMDFLSGALGVDMEQLEDPQFLKRQFFSALQEGNMEVADSIRRIWEMQNQRNAAEEEYAEQLERIQELQEAQADIQFLQQQMELLDLIAEHGLEAAEILGDLELGVDADPGAILDAMTQALQDVIAQMQGQVMGADDIMGSLLNSVGDIGAQSLLPSMGLPGPPTQQQLQLATGQSGGSTGTVNIFGGLHLHGVQDKRSLLAEFDELEDAGL